RHSRRQRHQEFLRDVHQRHCRGLFHRPRRRRLAGGLDHGRRSNLRRLRGSTIRSLHRARQSARGRRGHRHSRRGDSLDPAGAALNRLLILSVSAGAGHTRAAQALEQTGKALWPKAEILHADVLDFAEPIYRKGYVQSYLEMVNRAPELWGYLYRSSDHPPRSGRQSRFVRFFDRLEFARFRRFVRDFDADAVLATHFLPGQVFAPYRRRARDRFPLGIVLTDFDAHAFWVQPTADRFFVATEELAAVLAGRGIPRQKISVTGIPVIPAFARRHDRN